MEFLGLLRRREVIPAGQALCIWLAVLWTKEVQRLQELRQGPHLRARKAGKPQPDLSLHYFYSQTAPQGLWMISMQ